MAEGAHRPALAAYFPPVFALLYPVVCDIARPLGYAVALHGSCARDLDLIAVPWTEVASEPAELITAICRGVRARTADADDVDVFAEGPTLQPHGRLSWAIPLRIGAYLDVSVIPTRP